MFEHTHSFRITPHPPNSSDSLYSVDYLMTLFLKKDKFLKLMFFKETNPLHLHGVVVSSIKESAIRKWVKKWLPALKGNAYFQIHNCMKCKLKKHVQPCHKKAYTYVAKEGKLVAYKGFEAAELCEYVAKGKELAMTAKLTANDSRRLLWIGERYKKKPQDLHLFIVMWYEFQGQCPPSAMCLKRICRQIYFKYDANYRSDYEGALAQFCRDIYHNIL